MTCPHCESTATTERSGLHLHSAIAGSAVVTAAVSLMNAQGHSSIVSNIRRMSCAWWSSGASAIKLSLRDLAEMFLQRGITFTHEAVREWEAKLAPLLGEALRKRRHGAVGQSWYVDETYVRVQGQWQVSLPGH